MGRERRRWGAGYPRKLRRGAMRVAVDLSLVMHPNSKSLLSVHLRTAVSKAAILEVGPVPSWIGPLGELLVVQCLVFPVHRRLVPGKEPPESFWFSDCGLVALRNVHFSVRGTVCTHGGIVPSRFLACHHHELPCLAPLRDTSDRDAGSVEHDSICKADVFAVTDAAAVHRAEVRPWFVGGPPLLAQLRPERARI